MLLSRAWNEPQPKPRSQQRRRAESSSSYGELRRLEPGPIDGAGKGLAQTETHSEAASPFSQPPTTLPVCPTTPHLGVRSRLVPNIATSLESQQVWVCILAGLACYIG